MNFYTRFLMLFLCGVVQVFFAVHLLFDLSILQLPSDLMFIPGILIILTSIVLVVSYYYGKEEINNKLYDEYAADRFYRIGNLGYALNGIGLFIIFSIQDYQNWDIQIASNMILQIAAYAWLVFGVLLIWFAIGDYRESQHG